MNYGFVIDNRACIGCHACSTACKSENEVPLGVYRTWVKYVETGQGMDARRHFQVTRCNHCANPPCVRICPVTAMYQREDGIVEFDARSCIGCKACLQACPYDAIHIDPASGTAAKCHYCSHRTDLGLEPACVVVCPTHAIVAGDLDEPASEISRLVAAHKVTVRKPEQGTAPKLFYIEGTAAALEPGASDAGPSTFLWSDVLAAGRAPEAALPAAGAAEIRRARSGAVLREPQPQGLPAGGLLSGAGRAAAQMVQVSYNAQHRVPWHWPVPAYLVTKGIGSGILGLLSFGVLLGLPPGPGMALALFAALVALGLTGALLVFDLERPERFLYILRRPQWQSWLARGAVLLAAASAAGALWWLIEAVAALAGAHGSGWAQALRFGMAVLTLPLAAGTAVYTAFLFGQAEGRDLWQSQLLPLHMGVQAAAAGAAALLLLHWAAALAPGLAGAAHTLLAVALVFDVGLLLAGELAMPHASAQAARAAHEIAHGRYRLHFWLGALVLGHGVPLLLLASGGAGPAAAAGAATLLGLYLYEHAFVVAPQQLPNS
jgi:Fe-S-cluster-containing dehydrogenase component/formate-dependent nitrite reductase membrane component NrfD